MWVVSQYLATYYIKYSSLQTSISEEMVYLETSSVSVLLMLPSSMLNM